MAITVAIVLLALPALGVHGWMALTFPSYLHSSLGQDVVFAFAFCGLLVCVARWRMLHIASLPLALLAYFVWLFLVMGEGVSYYLQADTFNARFFAHLSFSDLGAGFHAFPGMIGGGIALLAVMAAVCTVLLVWMWHRGRRAGTRARSGPVIVTLVILVLVVLGVDSSPRRLIRYLADAQRSERFADTPQGRAVASLLDLSPVSKKRLVAAPGKNLVFIYLESLERIFWNSRIFPGLTPNLDRLRKQGLDFSGFQTFSGATYTIAGMFASQCGVPFFPSPFSALDVIGGNDTDAVSFHPKIVCLGDVLHDAGYTQIYMGGAPIKFSHKGLFYRLHGYNQALGLYELESAHHDKLPESGWGLYDSALFPLMLQEYEKLEAARKPFNLSMITLDTHPPDGRPSPGCPKYPPNPNSMLQAVHCTDYLVGKFVAALAKQPDWKNTVVVIMSDHLMMRNDAESLFPASYHRKPALLVLNAGHGVRPGTMYHMDLAPTLLDLLHVRTNATFIAGEDRSARDAEGSQLVDNAVTDAVLRKALWSHDNQFALCKRNTLVRWIGDGEFEIGGRELAMSLAGEPAVGVYGDQRLDFFIDNANATLVIANAAQQPGVLKGRGDAEVLTLSRLPNDRSSRNLFSVDWLGQRGARVHIADIPRLTGLTVESPHCGDLIAKADRVPVGAKLDLSRDFKTSTAPAPELASNSDVDFRQPGVVPYEAGIGWLPPKPYGSWAIGPHSILDFRLASGPCRVDTMLHMQVAAYLPPSRPKLVTDVWVNGKLARTWHFSRKSGQPQSAAGTPDSQEVVGVTAPVDPAGATCDVRVDLRFKRPDAAPPPYPRTEDARPLKLRVLQMRVTPAAGRG
ncbi:MAG: sulfatase-like hydrolase/transferase [Rhodanobacteraceae bacterium]